MQLENVTKRPKVETKRTYDDACGLAHALDLIGERWAMLIFIYGSHGRSEGDASIIAANVRFWHVVLATVATLAPATYFLGRTALWIGLSLSILALLYRALFHKRNGVLTQDNYGAVVEGSEALSLVLMATL